MTNMWTKLIIFIHLIYNGLAQEGSGGGVDPGGRLVDYSGDPSIYLDKELDSNNPKCVEKPFPGLGFKLCNVRYTTMFVCSNGLIRFVNFDYQNFPHNFGTRLAQRIDPVLAPFWAPVDLPSFKTGVSKVLFQCYHQHDNPRVVVFNRVNNDVRQFTGQNIFTATWVCVITWLDIKPNNPQGFLGKNQFQVVISSNETNSYVNYNYADIDWSVPAPSKDHSKWLNSGILPVMGWNVGQCGFDFRLGFQYQNLDTSGTVNADSIDDKSGDLGTGRFIFALSDKEEKSAALLCYEWFVNTPSVPTGNHRCPTTRRRARFNRRFKREDFQNTICFIRTFRPRRSPNSVRCCYDKITFALLTFIPSPGSVLLYHPRDPRFSSSMNDDYGYQTCCVDSNSCEAYFRRRPKSNRGILALNRGTTFGDPHYSNLDKMNYTFNGCGDFMFLDGNNTQFQIQARFSRAIGAGLGTITSAVVIKQHGFDAVQVNLKKDGGMLLLVNGVEFANQNSLNSTPVIIQEEIAISKIGEKTLAIMTADQHWIEVTEEQSNLVVITVLDESLFGKTQGLLGNWSGRTDDDYLLPNGTILSPALTDKQIHFDFGEKWRLTHQQNLFVNTTTDMDFSCPENYQPIFITNYSFPNSSFENDATNACAGNLLCLFDAVATLNIAFGENTLDTINTIAKDEEIIGNSVPAFTVADPENVVFNLTLGQLFEYTVSASDDDGDVIILSATGRPVGATLTPNGNSLKFSWLVNSLDKFEIKFTVTDSKNASTSLIPFINVCACQNGTCYKKPPSSQQTELTFNRFNILDCQCNIGFSGQFCETVKDFCDTGAGSPCYPLINCTNSPTGFICGSCPSGYAGGGQNCSDINECHQGSNNCEMLCVNTAGSFECQCNSGYTLNANKKNCDDINECTVALHNCMHTCTNTNGSFTCSCNSNFKVDPDNTNNCIPKTSCPPGHGCNDVCFVDQTTNKQVCSCRRGFRFATNDKSLCVDIDECSELSDRCTQLCTNSQGNYTCSCIQGYSLLADKYTCQDNNECVNQQHSCKTGEGEKCFNLAGSFKCECNDNQGLVKINGTCQVPTRGQVIPDEPAVDPPVPTESQVQNAVQLRIANFQSNQWVKKRDTALKSSIAAALTRYCNANSSRRTECGLPPRSGFVFSELNVNRLPNYPIDDKNDTLISLYAVYPNGLSGTVPKLALLNAIKEELAQIKEDTGLQETTVETAAETPAETPAPPEDDDDIDWPLALGVSIGVALILLMGIILAFVAWNRHKNNSKPVERVGRRSRRWSLSGLDTEFSISGETYQGFDADGLPVDIERRVDFDA